MTRAIQRNFDFWITTESPKRTNGNEGATSLMTDQASRHYRSSFNDRVKQSRGHTSHCRVA